MEDSTIPDDKELALREEKADLHAQMLPIIKTIEKLDQAKGKWVNKLIGLKISYHAADRELAMATKLTKVDKNKKQPDGTAALASILKDPKKAERLMTLLGEVKDND